MIDTLRLKQCLFVGGVSVGMALSPGYLDAEETTLREKLLERASQSGMPPEAKAKMTQHLNELTDSDIVSKAVKTGDKAPDFSLKDHTGVERSLSEYLEKGPVILTWYRGGW